MKNTRINSSVKKMERICDPFSKMYNTMCSYAPIKEETFAKLKPFCRVVTIHKNEILYAPGELPDSFGFVVSGLFRAYRANESGGEYNKNFFVEGQFPGCMSALLTNAPSELGIQALENSMVVEILFVEFRKLLFDNVDLMLFHINYLERNWLLEKDLRECSIVQQSASLRYMEFKTQNPDLYRRLPKYHIASHLGITPTQLSRIRKNL